MNNILYLVFILCGFLLGNVMFASLIPELILHKDVAAVAKDHNPGAGNVFVHCGVGWGLLCLFLDFAKGFVPVFLATLFTPGTGFLFALTIAAPVLGHSLGMFNHFEGGKCIATAFGVTFATCLLTQAFWILPAVFILFSLIRINPHRLRSIATFLVFGFLSLLVLVLTEKYAIGIGYALVSLTAVIKHTRLFAKDEIPDEAPQESENAENAEEGPAQHGGR